MGVAEKPKQKYADAEQHRQPYFSIFLDNGFHKSLIFCKGNLNRRQYKIKLFIFIVEMQPTLSKGNVKFRLSEKNTNIFAFLSERNLSKMKTIQNKFIYFYKRNAKKQNKKRRYLSLISRYLEYVKKLDKKHRYFCRLFNETTRGRKIRKKSTILQVAQYQQLTKETETVVFH